MSFYFECLCPNYEVGIGQFIPVHSAILIPWFLINYKGRVLHQITDSLVSYFSIFLTCWGVFCTSLSQCFITFWAQMSTVFPPDTLITPNPCRLFAVLSISSPSTSNAAAFRLQDRRTWLQSENLAEVGLLC